MGKIRKILAILKRISQLVKAHVYKIMHIAHNVRSETKGLLWDTLLGESNFSLMFKQKHCSLIEKNYLTKLQFVGNLATSLKTKIAHS